MILSYKCKFCGKAGSVDAGNNTHGLFDLTKWAKILCCTRCGEYMVAKRNVQDKIKASCLDLWATRKSEKNKEKLTKIVVATEENLIGLTKRYAKIVCEYYNKPEEWDVEIVYSLMEKPQSIDAILRIYRMGVSRKPTPESQ